ncbi:hypothetical protein H8B02_11720 [Bradyrhizobium sp. Pear77]|uniref:hypothetical protein n=1 Tax=Bradyrhizobium altum TaxID=1571202 RepID=UPI001E33C52F|nr:hypothetical protein [Bradyrhizobium altum]MCC8954104.1 hypothetical protein [Bradyrhizobium altum]
MGLFDAYDPNTYAPSQGGLIDRILQSIAAAPTNTGAGFPASPMNANAAMPPAATPAPQPQNAPMAIGDYSMPRIGSGFLPDYPQHDPHTGETIAAQPAIPAPVDNAPSPTAPPVNPLLKAAAALHSIAQGGSIYGAVTGTPDDAKSVQQRLLLQQAQALVNAGMSPQQAQAAVLNPEAGKTLIAQKFGPQTLTPLGQGYVADRNGKVTRAYTPEQNDSFSIVQTGQDGLGNKTFARMNKATGAMTPLAAAPGATNSGGLGDMSKTGAEYLATLPPDVAGRVKAMVEGRQAPPSSYARSKPYWQNLMTAAQVYDPTFDETNWSGRVAGVKDFSAGKSSEMVRSANQTLHHVNALLDSADALHNGNYPALNWAGNKFNEATGGGEPGAFRTNAHAVAEEMSKVFKGANMSDAEIHAWEENLSPNMSPAQQRAQIAKLSELLHGSLDALEEKRVAGMGQIAADKAGPLIKPEGQAVLKRIDAWLKAGSAAGASGTAPTGIKWSVVQ